MEVVTMTSGATHIPAPALWYGYQDEDPAERDFAYSRDESPMAYLSARQRAQRYAETLGLNAIVDENGIDRGEGLLWDMTFGAPSDAAL